MNEKLIYQQTVISVLQGLIASQTDDHRYVHQPSLPKEKQMVDEAIKITECLMNKLKEKDKI